MALDEKYPLALPQGTILAGQYVIGQVLGQGGFGITYKATDHKTGRSVAVKEFFPDSLATRTTKTTVTAFPGERGESFVYGKGCFLKEAETLAKFIGNENIVRVYSYFEENGTAYFVMEFIEGTSFDQYIKDHGGKIPYEEAQKILLSVIDALAAVHAKGIIHRDVTPDNIYITKDGGVKLLDFGAARYSLGDKSRSLDVVLKHGFAPKEQYTRHGKQGPYTDVYTVGASFYFAVTGRRPPDSIDRLEEDELVPPSSLVRVPQEKEDAILKAMSVQPAGRYQTMGEFRQALMGAPAAGTQNAALTEAADSILKTEYVKTEATDGILKTEYVKAEAAPIGNMRQQSDGKKDAAEGKMAEEKPRRNLSRKKLTAKKKAVLAGAALALVVICIVVINLFLFGSRRGDHGDRTAMRAVYENWDYECYSDGTAVLKKANNAIGVVNIPATVEYQSQTFCVTEIGLSAFKDCGSLTSIWLPDGVTSIKASAFQGCSSLTGIALPDSVTEIGLSAFQDCSSLISIAIPDGVTSIKRYTFDGCSGLRSVEIPDSVTSIEGFAFRGCSSLTGIAIPDSVTSIGAAAFRDCSSLTSIELPDGVAWEAVKEIVRECENLTTVIYGGRQMSRDEVLNGG